MHRFCFGCIAAWTEQTSRCPLCKRSVAFLRRAGGAPVAVAAREQRVDWLGDEALFYAESASEEEETPCQVCGRDDDPATLLLCDGDGCGGACHVACAGLPAVPAGEWLCARCAEPPPAEQAPGAADAAEAPQDAAAAFERFRWTQPGAR